jgi:hypothetical protein
VIWPWEWGCCRACRCCGLRTKRRSGAPLRDASRVDDVQAVSHKQNGAHGVDDAVSTLTHPSDVLHTSSWAFAFQSGGVSVDKASRSSLSASSCSISCIHSPTVALRSMATASFSCTLRCRLNNPTVFSTAHLQKPHVSHSATDAVRQGNHRQWQSQHSCHAPCVPNLTVCLLLREVKDFQEAVKLRKVGGAALGLSEDNILCRNACQGDARENIQLP